MSSALNELQSLQSHLDALRSGAMSVASLSSHARAASALLSALPPRYSEVLHSLLDRLESSALFSEESCSFSQKDLVDHLQAWLDKARSVLTT